MCYINLRGFNCLGGDEFPVKVHYLSASVDPEGQLKRLN